MTELLLLRTHRFGARERDFARRLRDETGWPLAILGDGAAASAGTGEFPCVKFDRARLTSLGLFCPRDAAWRCGDYGFALARLAFPSVARFWMIEPDVRAGVASYAEPFAALAALDADFLAPGVKRAERPHYWYPTMRWRTGAVWRCHFALCAMRAEAVDLCIAERRKQRFHPLARLLWPNDETFVVTTLARLGRVVRDINAAGRIWWTQESFGFRAITRGEDFDHAPPDALFHHPVLWGEDAVRKAGRLERGLSAGERVRLKLLRGLARLAGPAEAPA